MATNDVPGANPANHDQLAMGCWAEHQDGSLIFVYSTEGGNVIYTMFDIGRDPPVEYRDAMPEVSFKSTFSWKPGKASGEKWTWHDKTPFPWDRVIKAGFKDGVKSPSAEATMTAAGRVAESLRLKANTLADHSHRATRELPRRSGLLDKISRAIGELGR